MMNPFLSVSDSSGIKGGAGDSRSPSLSRIKNKLSTKGNFHHHKDMTLLQQKSEKSRRVKIPQKGFSLST